MFTMTILTQCHLTGSDRFLHDVHKDPYNYKAKVVNAPADQAEALNVRPVTQIKIEIETSAVKQSHSSMAV